MSFFNKLFGTTTQEQGLAATSRELIIPSRPFFVHPDIHDLLWIADGPRKNYTKTKTQSIYEFQGYRFIVNFSYETEPSLLSIKLPISSIKDISSVERPPYYPTYAQLTPMQKGVYWKLLENPYNSDIDIGFIFILYYGLERHLLEGDYEKAFHVILKLRDVHRNKSFQSYSACALILTCLFRKRADLAALFLESLDKEFELNFPDNMLLLCKYGLDIPLTCKDIMHMARTFEFENTSYIKKYSDIFENNLQQAMLDELKSDGIDIKLYLTPSEWKKLKKQAVPLYANMSILDKTIEIPTLSDCFKLKRTVYNLLERAHGTTKEQLAQMRKEGLKPTIEVSKPQAESAKPKTFEVARETQLLNELKESKARPIERHFVYISLQDFYYQYRELDELYLEKCIRFCEEDITCLPSLQQAYHSEEQKHIFALSSIYSRKEIEKRLQAVQPFNGSIPAFFRLAIIYEKRKNLSSAIAICNKAIEYYKSIGMHEAANEFVERKEKLMKKLSAENIQ